MPYPPTFRTLYGPTVGYLLRWLNNAEGVILVIDRTMIGEALDILMVSVAFRGRTLPLAWKIQKKQGAFQLRYVQAAPRSRMCLHCMQSSIFKWSLGGASTATSSEELSQPAARLSHNGIQRRQVRHLLAQASLPRSAILRHSLGG